MSVELVALDTLLNEVRDRVGEHARTKAIRVVVVGMSEQVAVRRDRVVRVVSALLRDAIDAVRPASRVAVTAQEIEGELVFAVYASGRDTTRADSLDQVALEAADVPGGRVWSAPQHDGNLALFAMPLAIH